MSTVDQRPGERRHVRWRRRQLVRAGFDPGLAQRLARDERSDIHALIGLVELGCAPHLAARIMAPIDAPEAAHDRPR